MNTEYYGAEKLLVHPEWVKFEHIDIKLIKTKILIIFNSNDNYYEINSVCPPKKYVINTREELVTVLGWGILPNKEYADYLQVSYALIKSFDEHSFDGEDNYIYHRQVGKSS